MILQWQTTAGIEVVSCLLAEVLLMFYLQNASRSF